MEKNVKQRIGAYIQIGAGLVLTAAAYKMFLFPSNIAPGGFTGIAQLIGHTTGWPVGTLALALNIPLFALSAHDFGWRFVIRSFVATLLLSLAFDFLPFGPVLAQDAPEHMTLACIFGGVIGGLGLGLILRAGATTGGSDMLARLVRRRVSFISIGTVIFTVDALVVLASALVFDVTAAMFALICAFLMGYVIDYVLDGFNASHAYLIISQKSDVIAARVIGEISRSATGLSGRGAYSGAQQEVLLCVVSRIESVQLRGIVASEDSNAFMIAMRAHEVLGEGFKPHIIEKT